MLFYFVGCRACLESKVNEIVTQSNPLKKNFTKIITFETRAFYSF